MRQPSYFLRLSKGLALLVVIAVAALLLVPSRAEGGCTAQDQDCSKILPLGLDFLRVDSNTSLVSSTKAWLYELTQEEFRSSMSRGFSLSVPGVGDLNHDSSNAQWRRYYNAVNQGKIENLNYQQTLALVRSTANPLVVNAWRDCVLNRQDKPGLQVVEEEVLPGKVILKVRYNAAAQRGADNTTRITQLRAEWEGGSKDIEVSNLVLEDRVAESLPTIDGLPTNKDVVIRVSTNNVGTWQRRFKYVPAPELPRFFVAYLPSMEFNNVGTIGGEVTLTIIADGGEYTDTATFAINNVNNQPSSYADLSDIRIEFFAKRSIYVSASIVVWKPGHARSESMPLLSRTTASLSGDVERGSRLSRHFPGEPTPTSWVGRVDVDWIRD